MTNMTPDDASKINRIRINAVTPAFPAGGELPTDGMSLREYLAAAAIAGNAWMVQEKGNTAQLLAQNAVDLADALLAELEEAS